MITLPGSMSFGNFRMNHMHEIYLGGILWGLFGLPGYRGRAITFIKAQTFEADCSFVYLLRDKREKVCFHNQ